MITGYENVPLLVSGLTMRVRDIPNAGLATHFPLARAGKTGLSCTGHDILNTLADTDVLPLAFGGGLVTVAEIKTFD